MKRTDIWIIIDEENLEVFKNEDGSVAKFHFKAWANFFAAERLNMWSCFNVKFEHKWLGHSADGK